MGAASISLAVNGAAASNVTDGATTFVPAGASAVCALQSSTGIKRWIVRADNPVGGSDPQGSLSGFQYQADSGGTFSVTIPMPRDSMSLPLISETLDANNNFTRARFVIASFQGVGGGSQYQRAAAVNTSNVNTASMNVVIDGQTLTAGETILLVNQTTAAQNGLYSIGTVAANLAALTRLTTLASGEVVVAPVLVEVDKGTLWAGSTWKTTTQGSITIDTTSIAFYPRVVRGVANLATNTINVTSLWAFTGATAMLTSTNIATTLFGTPTAGAGSGFMVITGAAAGGVGAIAYVIINWS